MSTFLVLLLIAAMIATVVALVRGIVAFLKNTEADLKGEGDGPSEASLRSNRMMQQRIIWQAVAILIAALLLFMFSGGRG